MSGFAPSQVELANKYYFNEDINVQKDPELAFSWVEKPSIKIIYLLRVWLAICITREGEQRRILNEVCIG